MIVYIPSISRHGETKLYENMHAWAFETSFIVIEQTACTLYCATFNNGPCLGILVFLLFIFSNYIRCSIIGQNQ